MRQNLKNQVSPIFIVSVLAVVLLAIAATNETVTRTATGAFSDVTGVNSEAAIKPETNAEETNKVNLQKGLQGYWRFDDPKVSSGNSLEFDGQDDFVSVSSSDSVSGLNEITIISWVKLDSIGSYTVVGNGGSTNEYQLQLWDDGRVQNYINTQNSGSQNCVGGSLETGKWHLVGMAWNGTTQKTYLDGEMVNECELTGDMPDSSDDICIGSWECGNSEFMNGNFDDLRVYNRSLPLSEVQELYKENPVSREGLVLYEDFNVGPSNCDLTSNTACLKDSSGNDNDGNPHNFNDNQFNTGSGWLNETPLNRPTVKDYSKNAHTGRFYEGRNGYLEGFDFNESNGWAEGKVDESAIKFSADSDRMPLNWSYTDSGVISELTTCTWFKTNSLAPMYGLGTDFDRSEYFNMQIGQNVPAGYPAFSTTSPNNAAMDLTASINVSDGDWHHMCGVFDSRNASKGPDKWLYLDGELVASDNHHDGEKIGSGMKRYGFIGEGSEAGGFDGSSNSLYFEGKLDDVRLYYEDLSGKEVSQLYDGKSVKGGLIGRWNFESGDRGTAYDSSSFGRKGILGTYGIDFDSESMGGSHNLKVDNKVSVSSWIKPEPLGIRNNPAESCSSIKESGYDEGSGEYWIKPDHSSETPTKVYCDMETDGGGWTRVVDKNYQNEDACPTEWSSKKSGQVCGPDQSGADYVRYDNLDGLNYDEVYVKSKLWEEGSNDAFDSCDGSTGGGGCTSGKEISYDQVIADGVSLYSGTDHIHTYAFGHDQSSSYGCPQYGGPNPPDGWEREDNQEYNCANTDGNDGWSNNFGTHQTMSDVKLTSSDFYITLSSDQSVSNEQQGVEDLEIYVRDSGEAETVSGGDDSYYIRDNGTLYRVHTFTETDKSSFSIQGGLTEVDLLLVGGGGGGGGRSGGGGGAGGLVFIPDYKLSQGDYEVKVGAGGEGGPADGEPTYSGENSSFANLTAVGGGAGATDIDYTGKKGGSGGGGKYGENGSKPIQPNLPGLSGKYGYGHEGGYGTTNTWKAGGGGGSGQKGIDGVDDDPGDGGNGLYRVSINSKEYRFNELYGKVGELINGKSWFAGGGGGGSHDSSTNQGYGYGGNGGGGHGGVPVGTNACGEDAMANTGGGGGGGSTNGGSGCGGGDGGSGIILVRYPVETVASVNDGTYSLEYVDGGLRGYVEGESVYADISTEKWQNVVLNFNGSSQKLYVDGEKKVSSKFNGKTSSYSENVVIGKNFNGKIDETRIYNRSLSHKEIQRLAFR